MSAHRGERAGPRPCRAAFTLLELLVAMSIIALLATLLLGVVMRARRQAHDTNCKSNLGQMWRATNVYANNNDHEMLFLNLSTPLQISNVVYKDQAVTGWGHLYPNFLPDYRVLFCPSDPVRDPIWTYGWDNWQMEEGEVRCSYGYRGRQGIMDDPEMALPLSEVDARPQKVFGCDFYGGQTRPPATHHENHINLLRCNGQVEQLNVLPAFGPEPEDFQLALEALDR